ncbi:hypothetical protein DBR47_06375 [Paucibacter sp. KBW04]|nr:hypothetical protein DBR47_06375 [Paucibacter sp. KBW04]
MQAPAQGQTQTQSSPLYRCGPEGRDLRDSPCPGGKKDEPTKLQYEQPSAAQTAAAQAQSAREAKLADAMERERLQQEARDRQANAKAGSIDGRMKSQEPKSTAGEPSKKRAAPKPHKAPKGPKEKKKKNKASAQGAQSTS